MTDFSDVKWWFHYFSNELNTIGNQINGWPWPIPYLASPFYWMATLFAWPDWIWDGLNYWINGIAANATNAWNYASSVYTIANNAWNWITWTGVNISSQASMALDYAVNAWNWVNSTGAYIQSLVNDAWREATVAINRSIQNLDAINWINSIEIPNMNNAIAEIRAMLEALEVPDLAAIIQDIGGLKTWRDQFIAGLDEKIASVISRTIDSVLDRVEW